MFFLIFLTIILVFAGVGIYGYLHGVMAPPFNPQTMTLNYERIGEGPQKVILLHGLTGSLNYWKRGLNKLSGAHSFLLIDLLGFGDSPKPNSKYNLEEHLNALEKVIKKEGFDASDTYLVGHSLGAILTIGLAAKRPEWFQGLVVIGLPVYKGKEALKSKLSKLSLWDGLSVDSRYKFVCFFHPLYMTEWSRPKNIPRDVFKDAAKHTWVSYYHTLDEVILNTDLVHKATQIKNREILIIHGTEDYAAPIENVEEILPVFEKAKFKKLPGVGHQVFLAEPDKIWALLTEFFNEH